MLHCTFCGQSLEQFYYRVCSLLRQRWNSLSPDGCDGVGVDCEGVETLKATCVFSPPAEGLGRRLWEGWRVSVTWGGYAEGREYST